MSVVDVSSAYAVYGVMGRVARAAAAPDPADLSDDAFPFATSREIDLGHSTVRATRITYVGELGWELYVPAEFAVGVYEDLFEAGADFRCEAGYYTINSLRLDKGYRAFGSDLTPDYNPVEAGLRFTCKLDRHRLRWPRRGRAGDGRRPPAQVGLVRLDDPDAMMWGGELVLRDGAGGRAGHLGGLVGHPRFRRRAGLRLAPGQRTGHHRPPQAGRYEINVGGRACGHCRSGPLRPANERIRGTATGNARGLLRPRRVTRVDGVTGIPSDPNGLDGAGPGARGSAPGAHGSPTPRPPAGPGPGRVRPRACATLLAPDGAAQGCLGRARGGPRGHRT